MPLLTLENVGIGTLALWQMTEGEEELRALCEGLEQGVGTLLWAEACSRFRAPKRQREWVSVRLLLHRLGISPAAVAYLPSGRPYLKGHAEAVSISHTQGYAAVLLSPTGPVGVDIERVSRRVHHVVDRFMDPADLPAGVEGDALTRHLLVHWSAREALFKCLDREGVDFRVHLHLAPFPAGQDEGTLQAWETRTPSQHHYTIAYRVTRDFVLTWCRG